MFVSGRADPQSSTAHMNHAFDTKTNRAVHIQTGSALYHPDHRSSAFNASMHVLELPYHSIVGSVVHHRTPANEPDGKVGLTSPTMPHTYFVDPLSQSHPHPPQSTRFMSPLSTAVWKVQPQTAEGIQPQRHPHPLVGATNGPQPPFGALGPPPAATPSIQTPVKETRRTLLAPPQTPPPTSRIGGMPPDAAERPSQWSDLVTRLMAPSFLSPAHQKGSDGDTFEAKTSLAHRYVATSAQTIHYMSSATTTVVTSSVETPRRLPKDGATQKSTSHQKYAPVPPSDLVDSGDVSEEEDVVVSETIATPSKPAANLVAVSQLSSSDGGALASPISVRHDDSKASEEDFTPVRPQQSRMATTTTATFASPRRPPPPPPVSTNPQLFDKQVGVDGVRGAPSRVAPQLVHVSRKPAVAAQSTRHAATIDQHGSASSCSSSPGSGGGRSSDDLEHELFAVKVAEAYAYDCYTRDSSYYMHPLLAKALHAREQRDRNILQDNQVIELGNVCSCLQVMLACSKLVKMEVDDRDAIATTFDRVFRSAWATCQASRPKHFPPNRPVSRSEIPNVVAGGAPNRVPHQGYVDPISEALLAPAHTTHRVVEPRKANSSLPPPAAIKAVPLSESWSDNSSWLLSDRSPDQNRRKRIPQTSFNAPLYEVAMTSSESSAHRPLNVAEFLLSERHVPNKGVDSDDYSSGGASSRLAQPPQRLGPVRPKKAGLAILAASIQTAPAAPRADAFPDSEQRSHAEAHRHARGAFEEELAAFHKVHVAPSRTLTTNGEYQAEPPMTSLASVAAAAAATTKSAAASPAAAAITKVSSASPPPRSAATTSAPHSPRLEELRAAILAEDLSDSSTSSRSSTPPRSSVAAPADRSSTVPQQLLTLSLATHAAPAADDSEPLEEVHIQLSASNSSLGSLSVDGVSE